MSLFQNLRTQKLLSFTMVLFTLSLGVVIGTLVAFRSFFYRTGAADKSSSLKNLPTDANKSHPN